MDDKHPKEYSQEMKIGEIKVYEQIQEEIFLIVKNGDYYLIALTNKIVSREKFATIEEAKEYIHSKPWELILNSTAVMFETIKNVENNK